eukprot:COSAG02_NODE_1913_length_10405_cov_3.734330_2_plen_69_part_00
MTLPCRHGMRMYRRGLARALAHALAVDDALLTESDWDGAFGPGERSIGMRGCSRGARRRRGLRGAVRV